MKIKVSQLQQGLNETEHGNEAQNNVLQVRKIRKVLPTEVKQQQCQWLWQ